MNKKIADRIDIFGAMASWICAVHCLVLPFLVGVLPLIGLNFLLSETTERFLIGISIILALLSLLPAYFQQHGKLHSIFLAAFGFSLVILTQVLFEENFVKKAVFLIVGAILISAAHILNRYFSQPCENC